jgi:hypothetical protein
MVLCRVNAPLVSYVFRLIKRGVKANIQGRDIGDGLLGLIKRLEPGSVEDLLGKIEEYHSRESQRIGQSKYPSEAALIALGDKCECLRSFCDGSGTLEDVSIKIQKIFTDDRQGSGVLLSSVHRAKGLEAKRGFHPCP